jgi:hypothetical protein
MSRCNSSLLLAINAIESVNIDIPEANIVVAMAKQKDK